MVSSNLKNILILKNLKSNIIDEAFVVLKDNKYFETKENKLISFDIKNQKKEYTSDSININSTSIILDEANNIVSDYFEKIEQEEKILKTENLNKKINNLKLKIKIMYLIIFILTVVLIII